MASPFPAHPNYQGFYAPFRAEVDAPDLIVEGTLPGDLVGTFYRNGPDPQYPPKDGDVPHWFDGDGMIYAFKFIGDGRVNLRSRWVRTPRFLAERAAGRRMFGTFGNPRFNDPDVDPRDANPANTHIWPHAERLFALAEAAPPTEIDPDTLETKEYDLQLMGGQWGPFTAHPKVDPLTGEMFAFGYMSRGPGSTTIRYNVIDGAGKAKRIEWFDQPYASVMHDMMLTENFAVFPCMPLVLSVERMMGGQPPIAWEGDRAAYMGIIPRHGSGNELRWVEIPGQFMFHIANAYEVGEDIVVEVAGAARAPLFPGADGSLPSPEETRFQLTRWVIPRNGGAFGQDALHPENVQFTRIDDRFTGRRYTKAFVNATARPEAGRDVGFDQIGWMDIHTGTSNFHSVEDGYFLEPVFVPREGSTGEADGYLLGLVWRSKINESELLVLDARDPNAGPLATVKCGMRIPAGFHNHWRGGTPSASSDA